MVWVGSFKSLQSALHRPCFRGAPLEVHTWVGTDIGLISSLVDWLMSLIAASRCVHGKEEFVELALRDSFQLAGHVPECVGASGTSTSFSVSRS